METLSYDEAIAEIAGGSVVRGATGAVRNVSIRMNNGQIQSSRDGKNWMAVTNPGSYSSEEFVSGSADDSEEGSTGSLGQVVQLLRDIRDRLDN